MRFLATRRFIELAKYRNIQRCHQRYYATPGCTSFQVCEASRHDESGVFISQSRFHSINDDFWMK